MTMRFEGEAIIPAAPETVWRGLNDPETLRRAIPGCTAMEQTGDTEFTATVVARVGPVSATFKGKVELADLNPPQSYTLRGRGQGGPAGFAQGSAQISLAPEGEGTRLSYIADVDIGGKLASVGGRLIQGVARKTADDFFAAFGRVVSGEADAEPEHGAEATGKPMVPGITTGALNGHIPLIDRLAWATLGGFIGFAVCHFIG